MNAARRPLVWMNGLVFAFASGVFCVEYFPVSLGIVYGCVGISLMLSAYGVYAGRPYAVCFALLLFFSVGYMRCVHDLYLPPTDVSRYVGSAATITGTVSEAPNVKETVQGKVSARYVVDVSNARVRQKNYAVSGRIVVYATQEKNATVARYGDQVRASGEIKGLHSYQNPGLIDGAASLRRQGVHARLSARDAAVIETGEKSIPRVVARLRAIVLERMEGVMPKQDAAALFAMLFGGYQGIRPELLEAFTATGIVHILSVSGSHITMLAAALQWLGNFLNFQKRTTVGLIIAAVVIYSIFSGCVPPVIRSAAMGILTFSALALRRESDARHLLAVVALAMLAHSPQLMYDISFQLSFAATGGLLYISPLLTDAFKRLPAWLAANLAITISAQISALPFLAWYFNVVSVSALLANLIAVPIIEFTIIGGLAAAIVGVAAPFLQNILFALCSLAMGLVYNITKAIAALPGGAVDLPSGGILFGFVYYTALFALLRQSQTNAAGLFKKAAAFKFPLLAAALILFAAAQLAHREAPMRLHFIDVGQGDAALLVTPRGKAALIDTGGVLASVSDFDVGARVVAPYLKHYGVRELEYLILTHAHDDHAGGAASVRRQIPAKRLIVGRESREEYARVLKTSLENCADLIPAYTGQTFTIDGVRLEIVHAMESAPGGTGNEVSNVVRISYGRHGFLITGDLDAAGEAQILANRAEIASTVLKVGHHGSKTSSTEAFLQAVAPRYAVISVGADNRFGHPNPSVLERLEQNGVNILRTDERGAIVFSSDGSSLTTTTFK